MTGRLLTGVLVLVLGMTGCGDGRSPTAPTAQPPPPPVGEPRPAGLTGFALSGVAYESTRTGRVPLEGVTVYCDACGREGHSWSYTDRDGQYGFSGDIATGGGVFLAADSTTHLWVSKDGYDVVGSDRTLPDGSGRKIVRLNGDTIFDIELVRR